MSLYLQPSVCTVRFPNTGRFPLKLCPQVPSQCHTTERAGSRLLQASPSEGPHLEQTAPDIPSLGAECSRNPPVRNLTRSRLLQAFPVKTLTRSRLLQESPREEPHLKQTAPDIPQ